MWPADQYQLIDFGRGRKLERFGRLILDRPSPAADGQEKAAPGLWEQADFKLASDDALPVIDDWSLKYAPVEFRLRLTPFGHVGLFPEHEQHWQWLRKLGPQPGQLLNLFAYTGGATLVMASAGWSVAHVDASAPTVAWARENAQLSDLHSASIRWLVEDARLFAARELKRGRKYDAILLDPPSYGHGPKGKAWSIQRDLPELIEVCCQLLVPGGALMLTGHSAGLPIEPAHIADCFQHHGHEVQLIENGRTQVRDTSGRPLDFGWFVRVNLKA